MTVEYIEGFNSATGIYLVNGYKMNLAETVEHLEGFGYVFEDACTIASEAKTAWKKSGMAKWWNGFIWITAAEKRSFEMEA